MIRKRAASLDVLILLDPDVSGAATCAHTRRASAEDSEAVRPAALAISTLLAASRTQEPSRGGPEPAAAASTSAVVARWKELLAEKSCSLKEKGRPIPTMRPTQLRYRSLAKVPNLEPWTIAYWSYHILARCQATYRSSRPQARLGLLRNFLGKTEAYSSFDMLCSRFLLVFLKWDRSR